MPAWVAWSAGRGKGAAIAADIGRSRNERATVGRSRRFAPPQWQSKAWPYEEARKLLKRYPDGKPGGERDVFETGYGPSGLPHLGTFQEVLRTT